MIYAVKDYDTILGTSSLVKQMTTSNNIHKLTVVHKAFKKLNYVYSHF